MTTVFSHVSKISSLLHKSMVIEIFTIIIINELLIRDIHVHIKCYTDYNGAMNNNYTDLTF